MVKKYIEYGLSHVMTDPKKSEQAGQLIDIYMSKHVDNATKRTVGFLLKNLVFDTFCGGETLQECDKLIDTYAKQGISSVLDYACEAAESDKEREHNLQEIIQSIEHIGNSNSPNKIAVCKPTAAFDKEVLRILSKHVHRYGYKTWDELLEAVQDFGTSGSHSVFEKCNKLHATCNKICDVSVKNNVCIFFDAEEHMYEPVLDLLLQEMMQTYNKQGKGYVIHTVQAYKKNALKKVEHQLNMAEDGGYIYGVKLVRGAYLEKEQLLALEGGYDSPVHESKEDTDKEFNECLTKLLENIKYTNLYIGSHNIESIGIAKAFMEGFSIDKDSPAIHFGQLHGMGDTLTNTAAEEGYNTYKYIPYGPFKETLAYLNRRRQENNASSSLALQDLKEREKLLSKRTKKAIHILSEKVLERQLQKVYSIQPVSDVYEAQYFSTLQGLHTFLEDIDNQERGNYRSAFMNSSIPIIEKYFHTFEDKISIDAYLNNFKHYLLGGYMRNLGSLDTPNTIRLSESNMRGYSEVYLSKSLAEVYKDIDTVCEELGIEHDTIELYNAGALLKELSNKLISDIYITLRKKGYNHKDLGGQLV